MKTSNLIVFLAIVLSVHTLVNFYIFIRGWQALPGLKSIRMIYSGIFIFLFLSYILARFLEKHDSTGIAHILSMVGSIWLAAMLYFFLAVLFLDLLRVLNHFFHFFPVMITGDWQKTKLITFIVTIVIVSVSLVAGYLNAQNPVLKELSINSSKPMEGYTSLRIVMASDIHLSQIFGLKNTEKLIATINELNPDIVLLPGDILDEDVTTVSKLGLGEPFRKLNPRLGIWASTGNHEYIGGAEEGVRYLESLGIKVLRDEYALIDNSFYLIGREDRDKPRFSGKPRKELSSIMSGIDKTKPLILMDHQPYNLEIAQQAGIDLQLSGHTHHGQLFPFNFITKMVYELSWGYLLKGNTHYYVSSGYGAWGPPVRIGNQPELVLITFHSKK